MTIHSHLRSLGGAAVRGLTFIAFAASFGCGGCKDEAPTPPPKQAAVEKPEEPPREPTNPILQSRQAYGAPLPPEIVYLKEGPRFIEVGTKLRLKELRKFFETRLVDVEYIERDKHSIRIVGLRSGMPTIWIEERISTLPTQVLYTENIERPRPAAPTAVAKAEPPKPSKPRQKGDPVEDRLPDGTLLAPGARWGEPYTPPPGTPLHDPRFRANFGKPFGTWVLN